MIKVSVLYANEPGARFDHDYYRDRHMPLVQEKLGAACLFYTVDKGVSGAPPSEPPAYVAMCHIFAESADSFWSAFGPVADEIVADIANYTTLSPVIQVSEVVVGAGPGRG
jgi:uncharacterized protein (TIGR02118 family)